MYTEITLSLVLIAAKKNCNRLVNNQLNTFLKSYICSCLRLNMIMQKYLFHVVLITLLPLIAPAQKITYSEPEKDDVRSVDFDIIGKIDNHYLVYKKIRGNHFVAVYDNEMKLADKISMDFLPDKLINSDIIAYRDYFYFIYQYQRRNVVY